MGGVRARSEGKNDRWQMREGEGEGNCTKTVIISNFRNYTCVAIFLCACACEKKNIRKMISPSLPVAMPSDYLHQFSMPSVFDLFWLFGEKKSKLMAFQSNFPFLVHFTQIPGVYMVSRSRHRSEKRDGVGGQVWASCLLTGGRSKQASSSFSFQ